MILYLTYNDQPSGVYWSQVTDVVDHLNTLPGPRVRLVALVSARGYRSSRRLIRQRQPDALVLPMVPRQRNWRLNRFALALVCRWLRPEGLLCRGIFATSLALRMRARGLVGRVGFDGRGAYAAEWEEFRLVDDNALIREAAEVERQAVLASDCRLAVSNALVGYWRQRFSYAGDAHVVVPCTLGAGLSHAEPQAPPAGALRAVLGWTDEDAVLVYSGSTAGWQGFGLAAELVPGWLRGDERRRALFLCQPHEAIARMERDFPGRVARRWVEHRQVGAVLRQCDIGLLVRPPCVTNRVASPTKFAEYLSAGLQVAISAGIGDFSEQVRRDGLGQVLAPGDELRLGKTPAALAGRLRAYAAERFAKERYNAEYQRLKAALAGR